MTNLQLCIFFNNHLIIFYNFLLFYGYENKILVIYDCKLYKELNFIKKIGLEKGFHMIFNKIKKFAFLK